MLRAGAGWRVEVIADAVVIANAVGAMPSFLAISSTYVPAEYTITNTANANRHQNEALVARAAARALAPSLHTSQTRVRRAARNNPILSESCVSVALNTIRILCTVPGFGRLPFQHVDQTLDSSSVGLHQCMSASMRAHNQLRPGTSTRHRVLLPQCAHPQTRCCCMFVPPAQSLCTKRPATMCCVVQPQPRGTHADTQNQHAAQKARHSDLTRGARRDELKKIKRKLTREAAQKEKKEAGKRKRIGLERKEKRKSHRHPAHGGMGAKNENHGEKCAR